MDHEVGIWDYALPVDDLDWVGFGLIDDDLGLGPDDDDPEEDEAAAVVDELAPLKIECPRRARTRRCSPARPTPDGPWPSTDRSSWFGVSREQDAAPPCPGRR